MTLISILHSNIDTHWRNRILCDADLYSSLQYMDTTMFKPGTLHPIVDIDSPSSRDVTRLAVKLKMITGTYLLQSNRASFNQTAVDPRCLLCGKEPETLGHLLLRCEVLDSTRRPLYAELCSVAEEQFNCVLEDLRDSEQLRVILKCFSVFSDKKKCAVFEYHSRRYCFALHTYHYERLCKLPVRKRHGL